MSTKRKLSPNAKTRKNIKRIKAQKAVLDRSRSSNSINSAATKSSNTLVLGGANRFMPERYHNIMEVIDTTNTVLGTGVVQQLVLFTLLMVYLIIPQR